MVDITSLLPIIITLAIVELSLLAFALRDWFKQDKSMRDRTIWLLIILFLNFIGPIIYFMSAPRNEHVGIQDNDVWTE